MDSRDAIPAYLQSLNSFHTYSFLHFITAILCLIVEPPPPDIPTPGSIFRVVHEESFDTKTEVPYCDPKGLICFRHAVGMDRCFRSRYGTSFMESTAFHFGGGDPIVLMILGACRNSFFCLNA